jgi:hypothetical protein
MMVRAAQQVFILVSINYSGHREKNIVAAVINYQMQWCVCGAHHAEGLVNPKVRALKKGY